jgi:hypothetical protein
MYVYVKGLLKFAIMTLVSGNLHLSLRAFSLVRYSLTFDIFSTPEFAIPGDLRRGPELDLQYDNQLRFLQRIGYFLVLNLTI